MYDQVEQTKFKSTHPLVRFVIESYKKDLLMLIRKAEPRIILDVGCGEGFISSFLKENVPARIFGVDYSSEMLSSSTNMMPVVCGNAVNLPFEERSIDLCLCLEVLEHLKNPQGALKELARVGKKSLISVPNDMVMRLGNLSRGKYIKTLGNFPGHRHHFDYFSFQKFLKKEFTIEMYRTSGLVWLMALVRPLTSS